MSHSKRNTSRPVFTAHERALAQSAWTESSARLNCDSFLPFGSCSLCLEVARDPVACPKGDVFCRECALANILAQKKELKRAEKARKALSEEDARKAAAEDEEDRARAIRDFEMTQAGLEVKLTARMSFQETAPQKGAATDTQRPKLLTDGQHTNDQLIVADKGANGTKRKFALDEHEVDANEKNDKAKARKAIEDEKAAKPTLPSFWTPSLTPDVHETKIGPAAKKIKTTPTCPASSEDSQHSISLQKLITINFDKQHDASTNETKRSCPSCRKVLSNALTPVLAKHCGHVLCRKCVDQFLIPSAKSKAHEQDSIIACFVCDEPVAVNPSAEDGPRAGLPTGLVSLKSEGTGFSARGTSTVEKSAVAFQC